MQDEDILPDPVTYISVLKACGSIGTIDKGKQLHAKIASEASLEENLQISNVLIDMYAGSGMLSEAHVVFIKIVTRDLTLWTSLIQGYSQFGKYDSVFNSLNRMTGEGIEPNMITFLVVLSACSSSGLVDEGQLCFEAMTTGYGIAPTVEHYTCMIDLFSRAGHSCKVIAIIHELPTNSNIEAWTDLLVRCL